MDVLSTPDQRFENLPGYPFEPICLTIPGTEYTQLHMHRIDEGAEKAEPVFLMHGEHTWSFLYRKMIPTITAAGYADIAPDLVGLGALSFTAS